MHTEIVRVSATDADCGHPYGEVCEYQITNGMEKTPFEITKEVCSVWCMKRLLLIVALSKSTRI